MSAGNGKQLRKVFYVMWNPDARVDVKVSEPSRATRNRLIREGSRKKTGE